MDGYVSWSLDAEIPLNYTMRVCNGGCWLIDPA